MFEGVCNMFSFNHTTKKELKPLTPLEIKKQKIIKIVKNLERWNIVGRITFYDRNNDIIFVPHICNYEIGCYNTLPDAVKAYIKKKRELFGVPNNLHLINKTDTDDEYIASVTEEWEIEFGKINNQDSIN